MMAKVEDAIMTAAETTAGPVAKPGNRLIGLDILRGLAALVVVIFHYTVKFRDFYPAAKPAFWQFTYGFYGVHLFFMISGFVILMSLSHPSGKQDGAGFIRSRLIRLYPIFWVSVLLTSAVLMSSDIIPTNITGLEIVTNLTMLQGYLRVVPVDGVYWSLSFELGFYFLLYMIFRLGFARFVEFVPYYMLAGAVFFCFFPHLIPHPLHYLLMINKYGHLFAGGMAFYLIHRHGFSLWRMLPIAAIPFVQGLYDGAVGWWVGFSIISLMSWAIGGFDPLGLKAKQGLIIRAMVQLGVMSYALYLTHQMIGYVAIAKLQSMAVNPNIAIMITLFGAILLAWLLTHYIERPTAAYLKAKLPQRLRFGRAIAAAGNG